MRFGSLLRKALGNRRGMTLIEVLVASAITVIILGGVGMLLFQSIHTQRDAELLSYVNNLAREKVESLKALGYDNIPVGETKEETGDGFVISTTVVSETDPATGYPLRIKTITVEVYTVKEEVFGSSGEEGLVTTHETSIHKRGL
jgi:prepilin-type N-terminal cleavage/methylation domain-containing protein